MEIILVFILALMIKVTHSCSTGKKNHLGILLVHDSTGDITKTLDLVENQFNAKGANFTLQDIPVWKLHSTYISCDDLDVIILLGDVCHNDISIVFQCNKPHLCINSYIHLFPDTTISDTFIHYPTATPVRGFIKHQVQLQGWENINIHVFVTGENEHLSNNIIDVLEDDGNIIRLYHVNNHYDIHTILHKVFKHSERRQDPKIIFIGEIDTFIFVFQQLNTSVHEGIITNYFQSEWLVLTRSNIKPVIQQLNDLIVDINIDGVGILQIQDQAIPMEQSLMEAIDMLQVYVQNLTSWDMVHGTWCPTCVCEQNGTVRNSSDNQSGSTLSTHVIRTLIKELPHSSVCLPYTLYAISWDTGVQSFYMDKICSMNKKTWLKKDAFPAQKMGLNGRHFKIVTLESNPFVMWNKVTHQFYGMCMDMLEELSVNMNFTYTLMRSPDGEFGVPINDTWTGMIGAVLRKEADLAVASLSASDTRSEVVDFVNYYLEFGGIIVKIPQREENAYRVIAQPFHWSLWLSVFVSVPIAGMITWWLSNMLTKGLKKKPEPFDNYIDAQWYVFGALLTQGGDDPKHFPTRSFVGCWWYFTVVIVAAYGGSLYSFLTINLNRVPFSTAEEMVQSSYTWGTTGGSFYVTELSNASEGLLQDMWAGIDKFSKHDPEILSKMKSEQFAKVKRGGYAFISDRTALEREAAGDQSCELVVLKYSFLPMPLGIALPKLSPYKRVFQKSVTILRSSGLLKVWQNEWWPKERCKGIFLADAGAIRLLDMQSSFYMLMIGITVACLCLIGEYLLKSSSLLKTLLPW